MRYVKQCPFGFCALWTHRTKRKIFFSVYRLFFAPFFCWFVYLFAFAHCKYGWRLRWKRFRMKADLREGSVRVVKPEWWWMCEEQTFNRRWSSTDNSDIHPTGPRDIVARTTLRLTTVSSSSFSAAIISTFLTQFLYIKRKLIGLRTCSVR